MDLSETATFTKRAVVVIIALLVVVYSSKYAIKAGIATWRKINPPIVKPTTSFGKLPALSIPSLKLAEGATPTFSVDTPTGRLPSFSGLMPVYKVITPGVTQKYEENAIALASKLGFAGVHSSISSSAFSWKNEELGTVLKMNVVTRNFSIESDWKTLKDKIQIATCPYPSEAKNVAIEFFESAGLTLEDYDTLTTKLARTDGSNLIETSSVSESQFTIVDFFRSIKPGEYPYKILGPNPKRGMIELVISGKKTDQNRPEDTSFVGGRYMFREIDKKNFSTYPVKSVEAAYQELSEGKGSITYLKPGNEDFFATYTPIKPSSIKIREIYIAYFEPETLPQYLQPIFVFEGKAFSNEGKEGEYIAYVPALSNEWIK